MKEFIHRAAGCVVSHRSSLPQWLQRTMESAARNPDGLVGTFAGHLLGADNSQTTDVPKTPIRVYIAPTNYAGQGFAWARALEHAESRIAARNLEVTLPGGYAFSADTKVSIATVNSSVVWAEAEWLAARQFTHVLIEAERSIFGKRFNRNIESEVAALEAEGVSVAMLCHGTDIRDPDENAARSQWSPFPEDPRTDILRTDALKNRELLLRLGKPIFVSTPDLILDVPEAFWCPVIVDTTRFHNDNQVLVQDTVRVIHASSNPLQKGSHYITPALTSLIHAGHLEYKLITSTPSTEMPSVFAEADIVIDQFRVGSYGTAACEAMAAGRIVIGHVLPEVREYVEKIAGMPLPIVEATPENLSKVISTIVQDREASRQLAASGITFVEHVHNGKMSAKALLENWIFTSPQGDQLPAD